LTLKLILILAFTLLTVGAMAGISFFIGKKIKDNDDWAVGGRSLPWYVVVGTQYATAAGGAFLVAHVGLGYGSGWFPIVYGIFAGIGLLIIAAMARWLREQGFSSLPDILTKIFGYNKTLIAIGAIASIIVPFAASCTQLVAFGKLFSNITGMNTDILIIIFAIISVAIVLPAGLKSVAWTDFILGVFMFVFTVIVSIYALTKAGGWGAIQTTIPDLASFPSSMGAMGPKMTVYFAITLIAGTITMQAYYQRVFAVDKVENARKTIYYSIIALIACEFFAAILGMSIRVMNPDLTNETATGWFLTIIPPGLLVIYSGFIVVTIMSTVDSLIQSAAINVTRDFYHNIINPDADDKKLMKINRIACIVIVAFSLAFSLLWQEALGWLLLGYSYSAATLLVVVFVGFLLKDKKYLTPQAGVASMIFGIIGAAVGQYVFDSRLFYPVYGFAFSLVALVIVSLISREKYYAAK
jgi:SSS family solute:Na+ symporter|tara:strand:- start:698 stop:2101 length:1404 start_codon:yes stop_codon:yes gene_type:complete